MKNFFNNAIYAILLASVFNLISCSSEEPIDFKSNESETLTANSVISQLMERTVSNDGSHDNIVDGSSCFDIRLPYQVLINDLEITINSEDDLKFIEELFDAVDSDDDILDIIFPIVVTMADYSELTINDISDLKEIAEKCVEGGNDDDIECIDVIYPVTLFTYDINLEKTGSITILNDMEMRRFFAGLEENDLISIDFPVMFETFDGTKITANNNQELIDAIELAKETCDEDDDNDHNDDDFTKESLDSLLVACPLQVKEIIRSSTQGIAIEEYAGYLLNFKEDGTVIAQNGEGNMLEGLWDTKISDYRVKLTLDFEYLEVFSLEWLVYEIDEDTIKLYLSDTDGDKIIMKKACEEAMVACTESFIKENLQECVWEIDIENENVVNILRIDFSNMNIHVREPNGVVIDEGNWSISGTTLTFNNLSLEWANAVGDWQMIECSEARFKLKKGEEYLVLKKYCE